MTKQTDKKKKRASSDIKKNNDQCHESVSGKKTQKKICDTTTDYLDEIDEAIIVYEIDWRIW